MGFNLAWVAVRGKAEPQVYSELALVPTDEKIPVPDADIAGVVLPSGWQVLVFKDPLAEEAHDPVPAALSTNAEVITCLIAEVSSVSVITGYANGVKQWTAIHMTEQGPGHLEVQGNVPPQFQTVLEAQQRQMKEDDSTLFEFASALGEALTGYRFNQFIEGISGPAFRVIRRA